MADDGCTVEQCDIFDFMANYAGMSVLHPGGLKATRQLAESCQIGKRSRVIDIACGKGTGAVYLAENYGCQVVGIEISETLVAQAARLARHKGLDGLVSFCVANALSLPFADGEFDAAVTQAALVLVSDPRKAVQEALRVTRAGGRLGWLELSWRRAPTEQFLAAVSNVICARCMLNVRTFEGWQNLLKECGITRLEVVGSPMRFNGVPGMVADEGWNAARIIYRYLTHGGIRRRMNTISRFFRENAAMFGYGIYVATK